MDLYTKREELRHEVEEHPPVTRRYCFEATVWMEAESEAEAAQAVRDGCSLMGGEANELNLMEVE